jgi:NCK-associated protein 1
LPAPGEAEKLGNYADFAASSSFILGALNPIFEVLLDTSEWVAAAFTVLTTEVAATTLVLDPLGPIDASRLVLSLITRYIKIHAFLLDWGKDGLRRVAAGVHKLRATTDPIPADAWQLLVDPKTGILGNYLDDGLADVCARLAPLAPLVGSAVSPMFMAYAKSRNTASLRKEGLFSLVLKPDEIASPAADPGLLAALRHADLAEWPLFALLACPKVIEEDETALGLLRAVLSDHWVIPIFRDAVLYPHKVVEDVLLSYASRAGAKGVKKQAKQVSDWAKEAPAAFARRADARTFLRHELGTMLTLVQDKPGLFSPKAPLILAACSMASAELVWLYTHQDRPPPPSHKRYEPEKMKDPRAIELIYYVEQLWGLAARHERLITAYHLELLASGGAKVAGELAGLLADGAAAAALQQIGSMAGGAVSAGGVDALELRRSWASAQVSAGTNPQCVPLFLRPDSRARVDVMHFTALHSLLAIGVDATFAEYVHLRELWFFKDALLDAAERCMTDGPVQPKAVSSVLRLLSSVVENATVYWAQEREFLGAGAVEAATKILNSACKAVCISVHEVAIARLELDRALTDEHALVDQVRAKVKNLEDGLTMPGTESRLGEKRSSKLEHLRLRERALWQLLTSLNDFATIVIYDSSFCPAELLRAKLRRQFQGFVRTSVGEPSSSTGLMERPSVIEARILAYVQTMMMVEEHMDLDVGALIRSVWLGEVYQDGIGFAGSLEHLSGATPDSSVKSPRVGGMLPRATSRNDSVRPGLHDPTAPIGEQLSAWFAHFLATKARKDVAVYSPLRRGFAVRGHGDASSLGDTLRRGGGSSNSAEDWVDLVELTALARLVGPYGMKMIERPLIEMLLGRVKAMRDILSVNKPILEQFSTKFAAPAVVETLVKKAKDMDTFMTHAAVVGNVQFLRELLHVAMADALDGAVPGIFRTLRDATQNYQPNLGRVEQLTQLDTLASHAGVPLDHGVDPSLLSALAQWTDPPTWQHLPYMFALCIHSKWWSDATFNSALDAFLNHTSAVGRCLTDLVVAYAVIDPERRGEPRAIRRFLDAFVESASMQVLAAGHTHKGGMGPLLIFLDQFVTDCPHLTRETLERSIPYSLIRNAYTAAYTGGKVKGKQTDAY